tara:strand:- start:24 stop:185 length:162 start_codon:yes stop_codon:yes gene_type:complete
VDGVGVLVVVDDVLVAAYVPPLDVDVPVEVAVEGKIEVTVETGEFDFRVKVGV